VKAHETCGIPPGSLSAHLVRVPSEADLLRDRLDRFGTRVIRFIRALPDDPASKDIAFQLGRAGPGIGSNHRSARRARSRAEFISRLAVALDEADESEYWLSRIQESGITAGDELEWLAGESRELRAVLSTSVATARRNYQASGPPDPPRNPQRRPQRQKRRGRRNGSTDP
jgi:four helix bundle protein